MVIRRNDVMVIKMVSNLRSRTIVTSGGRISIPKKIRDALSIKEGSVLELYIYKGKMIIEVLVT